MSGVFSFGEYYDDQLIIYGAVNNIYECKFRKRAVVE